MWSGYAKFKALWALFPIFFLAEPTLEEKAKFSKFSVLGGGGPKLAVTSPDHSDACGGTQCKGIHECHCPKVLSFNL